MKHKSVTKSDNFAGFKLFYMTYGNISSSDPSSNFKIAFKVGADGKNWNYLDKKLETSKSQLQQVEEKRYVDIFQYGHKFSSVKICDDLQYTLQF